MTRLVTIVATIFVALLLLSSTMYVVDQREYAILFEMGKIKEEIKEPGLHFKLPSPFQNVRTLPNQILTIESEDADRFITAEKNNILVDAFVKWRITDPRTYWIAFGGDEGSARNRMSQIVKAALNEEITKHTVHQMISSQRAQVMEAIRNKVASESSQIGVGIVDVRLKRVDYVEQINNSVFERMKAERARVANELRSTGGAESEKIRADADRQATIIIAEAYRDAQQTKGEGDAKASQIYATAFGKNPEFYRFYRSLEAYKESFKNRGDVMVVDPNSDFFKYFHAPGGAAPAKR
ncbi:MAG: protease modulator HflC [Telluria sp.]